MFHKDKLLKRKFYECKSVRKGAPTGDLNWLYWWSELREIEIQVKWLKVVSRKLVLKKGKKETIEMGV